MVVGILVLDALRALMRHSFGWKVILHIRRQTKVQSLLRNGNLESKRLLGFLLWTQKTRLYTLRSFDSGGLNFIRCDLEAAIQLVAELH